MSCICNPRRCIYGVVLYPPLGHHWSPCGAQRCKIKQTKDPPAQDIFIVSLGYVWAQRNGEPPRSRTAAAHQMAAAVIRLRSCLVATKT